MVAMSVIFWLHGHDALAAVECLDVGSWTQPAAILLAFAITKRVDAGCLQLDVGCERDAVVCSRLREPATRLTHTGCAESLWVLPIVLTAIRSGRRPRRCRKDCRHSLSHRRRRRSESASGEPARYTSRGNPSEHDRNARRIHTTGLTRDGFDDADPVCIAEDHTAKQADSHSAYLSIMFGSLPQRRGWR